MSLINKLVKDVKKIGKFAAKPLVPLTIVGAATLYTGCAPTAPEAREFPKGHIHGYNIRDRTQEDNQYKLETNVLYGDAFYFKKTTGLEDALPFLITPVDSVTREIDLNTGKVVLTSYGADDYVPVRAGVGDGKWAKEVELSPVYSKTIGVRGIKADMKKAPRKGIEVASFVSTEDDAKYGIKTEKILEERYFIPHVEVSKKDEEEKLKFYMIPLTNAKLKIREKDGVITIENENNIFRPVLYSGYLKYIEEKRQRELQEQEPTTGHVKSIIAEPDTSKVIQ